MQVTDGIAWRITLVMVAWARHHTALEITPGAARKTLLVGRAGESARNSRARFPATILAGGVGVKGASQLGTRLDFFPLLNLRMKRMILFNSSIFNWLSRP